MTKSENEHRNPFLGVRNTRTKFKKPESLNLNEDTRKCLSCQEDFASEWVGNRICNRCKNTSKFR